MDYTEYDWDDDEEFYQNRYTVNIKFSNPKQKIITNIISLKNKIIINILNINNT